MAGRWRWFQFKLRTLMIVVTILAVFLGYPINWMRQRHNFLIQVDRSGSFYRRGPVVGPVTAQSKPAEAPLLLRVFGERGQERIVVSINDAAKEGLNEDSQELLNSAKRLFPEAELLTVYVSLQGQAQVELAEKLGY